MADIIELAVQVFRDYVTDNVPASGPNKPSKSEIRALFSEISTKIDLTAVGIPTYATKADLDEVTPGDGDPQVAFVNDDASPANNTIYTFRDDEWDVFDEFYDAVAGVVQPLVDQATEAAADAAASAAEASTQSGLVSERERFPDDERLFSFQDAAGREVGSIDLNGELDMQLGGGVRVVAGTRLDSAEAFKLYVVDAAGKHIGSLDPVGLARPPYMTGPEYLGRFRWKRRQRLNGVSAQINWGFFGDSYTHLRTRYAEPITTALINELGDAGGGWVGFGDLGGVGTYNNGNIRSTYTYSHSGTWGTASTDYYTSPTPDLAVLTSSSAGAAIAVAGPATPVLSSVDLCWIGTSNGVMRYRWNGGSWTSINVQGTVGSLQSAALTGMPSSGAWTFDLEVVSGSVKPSGLYLRSAASGFRGHKFGATGLKASDFAAVNATNWKTGIALAELDGASIVFAPNEQAQRQTMGQFATALTTMVTRLREVRPSMAIVLGVIAENQTRQSTRISDYAVAMHQVAQRHRCAFLNCQDLFGPSAEPELYASGGDYPMFNADKLHIEPGYGGTLVQDAFLRLLQHA